MLTDEEVRDKVLLGTHISIQRLIARKQKEDGYLVIERNGEVVKLRARDIVLKLEGNSSSSP